MTIGLLGKKCGMTRIFTEDGASIPVTVLEIVPNRVTQVKTVETDGYNAIQVSAGERKASRVSKPETGHFAKAGVVAGELVKEFRLDESELAGFEVGSELKVDRFSEGQYVDVTGTSKGKGFAGTIKRWHFAGQDQTHGNSLSHRAPGSIGQRQTPGRVMKGKKMSGHLGNVKRTVLSQTVVKVDVEKNLILVRGAVPGAESSYVVIRPAVKKLEKSA